MSQSERAAAGRSAPAAAARLREILDASALPIIAFDADGLITLWTKAAESTFGWTEAEVLGGPNPLVPEEEQDAFRRAVRLVFEQGKAWRNVDVPRRTKDGTQLYVSASSAPLRDRDGNIVEMVSVLADVTERRKGEQALRESEELFRVTFDNAPIAVALIGPDGRWLQVNAALCDLLGYSEEEMLRLTFPDVTHPDDLPASIERRRRQLAGENDMMRAEKRYIRSDGKIVWAAVRSTLVRDADGNPLHTVAQIEDITERLETQRALEEAEERFRRAFDDAPIGMALVAVDGRFVRVNLSLCEITGYEESELLELTFQDITHPDDLDADLVHLRRLLDGEARAYQMEKRYVRADGQIVWIMLSVSIVRDAEGSPLYLVSQIEDISQRKRAERELQHLADYDSLTGIGNRRKLMGDLERTLETTTDPQLLVIFDLNGFKQYNDTFGHPAGDALLVRLAVKLTEAARPHGEAYRLGGDEFCVLAAIGVDRAETFLDATAAALSEEGEGFNISSSFGAAFLPEEAAEVSSALSLADQRLYVQKHDMQVMRDRPHELLLRALSERERTLREHSSSVAALSVPLGSRLGLTGDALEELRLAAELHDVGKLAIPDAVLGKAGPLDEEEWAFVRQHTVIGERILAGAPALRGVAAIVRSTHERWDGGGYVDGLAGREIPLPARIIAVCDAYAAMTAHRPYREALTHEHALAELRRCAGEQFDPSVVGAFCAEYTEAAGIRAGTGQGQLPS